MKRKVFAVIDVDDEMAFTQINDGPVAYLEKEFERLEQSGISLDGCFVADEDADSPWERYTIYLAQFAFDHVFDDCDDVLPMTFKRFISQP